MNVAASRRNQPRRHPRPHPPPLQVPEPSDKCHKLSRLPAYVSVSADDSLHTTEIRPPKPSKCGPHPRTAKDRISEFLVASVAPKITTGFLRLVKLICGVRVPWKLPSTGNHWKSHEITEANRTARAAPQVSPQCVMVQLIFLTMALVAGSSSSRVCMGGQWRAPNTSLRAP